MHETEVSRRDFSRLSLAALGGALAGSLAGCTKVEGPQPAATSPKSATEETVVASATPEVHLCRGLNSCKNQGAGKDNACAGQGTCATAAHHDCGSMNECKGLGGCGADAGENACKGKGGCHVPLMEHAWEKGREKLEKKMTAEGKTLGAAPAKST